MITILLKLKEMSFPLTQLSQKRPYQSNFTRNVRSKRAGKTYSRGRVPMATKSAIAKAISESRETKFVNVGQTEVSLTTVSGTSPYIFPMATPSQEGTGVEQRIGHQINPIANELKFILFNNATKSVIARVIYFRTKNGMLENAIRNDFFEGTAGIDNPSSGNLSDMIKPVNREYFHVYHDEMINLGYENAVGITTPHARVATGTIRVKPLKTMTFSEPTNGGYPVTGMYYCAILIRRADNDESIGEEVEFSYRSSMYYKD